MSEKIPSAVNPSSLENDVTREKAPPVSAEEVISLFKKEGQSQEAIALYSAWLEQIEQLRHVEGMSDAKIAGMELDLLIESGLHEYARERCNDIQYILENTVGEVTIDESGHITPTMGEREEMKKVCEAALQKLDSIR